MIRRLSSYFSESFWSKGSSERGSFASILPWRAEETCDGLPRADTRDQVLLPSLWRHRFMLWRIFSHKVCCDRNSSPYYVIVFTKDFIRCFVLIPRTALVWDTMLLLMSRIRSSILKGSQPLFHAIKDMQYSRRRVEISPCLHTFAIGIEKTCVY